MSKQNHSKKITPSNPNKAPALPAASRKMTAEQRAELPVTDPRRRLSKEERKALKPDERKARKAAILAKRGPAKGRYHRLVVKTAKRFSKIASMLAGSEQHAEAVETAKKILDFAGTLDGLPADWKPARAGASAQTAKFAPGDMVQIKPDQRGRFDGLLPKDELDGLVVVQCKGREVLVRSESGTKIFVQTKVIEAAGAVEAAPAAT